MIKNRVLSYLIIVTLVFSFFSVIPASAEYSDYVYLEYGFDDYTGGAPHYTGTKVKLDGLTNQNQANKLYAGTDENGNKYLYSDFDAYCEAKGTTSWANVGFQLTFDSSFPTSGQYAVSFDIGRGDLDEAKGSAVASLKMSNNAPRIVAMEASGGKFHDYAKDNDATAYGSNELPFDKNVIYRVDVVFDLDDATFKVYVDGKLLSSGRSNSAGLAGRALQFRLEHEIQYIDNVKVAKVSDESFVAKVTPDDNCLLVEFSETVQEGALDDAVILNTVTGEIIEPEDIEKVGFNNYNIVTYTEFIPGVKYVIQTEKPVKNFAKTPLYGEIAFTLGEEGAKYVKSVKLVDYQGKEYYPSEELVPEINTIKIYYTGIESPETPSVALINNSEELGFDALFDYEENVLTLTLDEYLIGENDYELDVNDALLAEEYDSVAFSTTEGSVKINKFTFTKTTGSGDDAVTTEVEDIAELGDGDVIDLEIEIIKTTQGAQNMILSYSLWADGFLKGFNFKDVSAEDGETYISDKITGIEIDKNSELTIDSIKGFLWSAFGNNNPLSEEIKLQ